MAFVALAVAPFSAFAVITGTGTQEDPYINSSAEDPTIAWTDVTVETAGSLGVEILYQFDQLADVQHLRVHGPLNDADWTTLKNLTNIVSLDLSDASATAMPASQFRYRRTLTTLIFPSNLKTIGEYALSETSIKNLVFPASLSKLDGNYICYNNTALESVAFESGCTITSIPYYTFQNCTKLKTVEIPEKVTAIGQYAFYECTSLESVKLPEGLNSIGAYSFYKTSNLKLIDFPESLRNIGNFAFQYSGLTSIVLPKALTTAGSGCFANCSSATDLTLSAVISSYTSNQFSSCTGIKNITCPTTTPPTINGNTFSGLTKADVSLHVPEFAAVNYKLDASWLSFNIVGDFNSNYWCIKSDFSLTNNRRWEGTPSVDLYGNGCFTIGGNAPLNIGNLMMYDNIQPSSVSSRTYAQIINNSPSVTAENITLKKYIEANYWHFISIPFDVNVADITKSNSNSDYVIRYYDGAQRATSGTGNSWKNVPADGTLQAGKGYIIQSNNQQYINFLAADGGSLQLFNPNAQTIDLEKNPSDNAANAGWNLVGNPYQSYYDMYYTMLTVPVTVWDFNYRKYVAYSLIDDDLVLEPGQAFFIQASDDLAAIEFGTLGRQFTRTVSRAAMPAKMPKAFGNRKLFNITLNCGEMTDMARVVLNEEASEEYESNRDAAKFFSDDATVAQFYTIGNDNEALAINERPEADGVVRLGFYAPVTGKMSISADRLDGNATLVDALTGKSVSLTGNAVYEFEVEETGFNENRFSLILKAGGMSSIDDSEFGSANVSITVSGNTICVNGCGNTGVDIYNCEGQLLASQPRGSDSYSYNAAAGIYIVKAGEKVFKCAIR